ncbi:MAG: hypothetical protein AB8I08_03050 [Sandaracinaceae bacterium]
MPDDSSSPYSCPLCDEHIEVGDVNLETRAAHCRACDTPFSLPAGLYASLIHPAVPKGVTVESGEQAQYLEWLVERHLGIRDDPGFNRT